jgi:hypothetical protein
VSLSEPEVIDHLVAVGILRADDIVDRGLTIESSTRRNRNLRITWPDGSGYFVKLPDSRSPMSRSTLRSEIDFYRATAGRARPFDTLLARFVHADSDNSILVLELQQRNENLREAVSAGWPDEFPISLYRMAGEILASVHDTDHGTLGTPASPPSVAPVANYGRPDPWLLGTASRGTLMLMEMLQNSPALSDGLTDLARQWRADTLVHGDIRADNILVGTSAELCLVDWELWHVGDPAQDLAGLLYTIISATVGRALDSPSADLDSAGTIMQAACHSSWRAYVATRGLAPPASHTLSLRTAAFTAARIVQSEVEVAEHVMAVSGRGCDMLQMAEHIFTDPERAAAELLGLR